MAKIANYTHSRVFDSMKHVKERIPNNYTSLQYLQTLDFFLWNALKPIAIECPRLFYNYMAKVVARQTLRASAKLTSDDKHKLPLTFFNALMISDDQKQFEATKLMYVNRGLLFGFISLFLRQMKQFQELQVNRDGLMRLSQLKQIETNVGLRRGGLLYPALMDVTFWDAKALTWKSMITEKYTRMTLGQAQHAYTDYHHVVDLDDVIQIYLMTLNKSIDRCDARQGVLTTFIQNWFKSAKGEVAALADKAQDQSIESLVEDHGDAASDIIGCVEPSREHELMQHAAAIAARIDPQGLVRTSLGIAQNVTTSDRKLLELLAC